MAVHQTQQTDEPERAQLVAINPPRGTMHRPQDYRGPHTRTGVQQDDPLVRGLGWFSNGLGIMGTVAPDTLAHFIGIDDTSGNRKFLRFVGMREIASGVGILAQSQPSPWLWSRVAGDVMDLSYLTFALLSSNGRDKSRVAAALAAVAGVTALDLRASRATSGAGAAERGQVRQTITIGRPVEEVYQFWRNFENLPRFMSNLESVRVTGDRRSHWKAMAPAGESVEWDAELVDDRPNELISWRSLPQSQIPNRGQVEFRPAPGNRGTEIQVDLQYEPPAGQIGQVVARLFGKEPGQQVPTDLRRLKQILEAGDIIRSDATIQGVSLLQRPAQPAEAAA